MSYEIATVLSQQVLEKRRSASELGSPNLYPAHRVLNRITAYRPARFGVCPNDVCRAHPESRSIASVGRLREKR